MSKEMICPFCGEELVRHWGMESPAIYCCDNQKCKCGGVGTEQSWQALIQAKQDLEKARYAITDVFGYVKEHEKDIGGCAVNIGITLGLALGQIEHKEI